MIVLVFNRWIVRLLSICRRVGVLGDDDKEIERGEYEYFMILFFV